MTNKIKGLIKFVVVAAVLTAAGCSSGAGIIYQPYPQTLPQGINKIAVRPFINKTEYYGLEDRLTVRVTDEFLRNGRYPVVSEANADGIVAGEIRRYILVPVQYNASLVPTQYKLTVLLKVQFYDKARNVILWEEPAFEGVWSYTASTMPGGMTEDQAREAVWDILSRLIVKRTIDGYGAATSQSERKIQFTENVERSSSTAVNTTP